MKFPSSRSDCAGAFPCKKRNLPSTAQLGPSSARTLLILGGFDEDTPKHAREEFTNLFIQEHSSLDKIRDMWAPGRYASFVKIDFNSANDMWKMIKALKGCNIFYNPMGIALPADRKPMWWSVEKSEEERICSKRISRAVSVLRQNAMTTMGLSEEEARQAVEGDWSAGKVYIKTARLGHMRILSRDRVTKPIRAEPGLKDTGLAPNEADFIQDCNAVSL